MCQGNQQTVEMNHANCAGRKNVYVSIYKAWSFSALVVSRVEPSAESTRHILLGANQWSGSLGWKLALYQAHVKIDEEARLSECVLQHGVNHSSLTLSLSHTIIMIFKGVYIFINNCCRHFTPHRYATLLHPTIILSSIFYSLSFSIKEATSGRYLD